MRNTVIALMTSACSCFAQTEQAITWVKTEIPGAQVITTVEDSALLPALRENIAEGRSVISSFFGQNFPRVFQVHVFPHRAQLDAQWQKDWGAPDFKSECWMVASGVAHRLDLLSPAVWSTEACEHNANDQLETQRLITHEMVHVYHGQHNPVPDFTGLDDLAWLIEGVATYASGQLTDVRVASVRKLVEEGKAPTSLAKFWSGKDRYGLAGSLVKYVDARVGRNELFNLLKETKQSEILAHVGLSETELIEEWKKSILK
jgi:hypothetical protein